MSATAAQNNRNTAAGDAQLLASLLNTIPDTDAIAFQNELPAYQRTNSAEQTQIIQTYTPHTQAYAQEEHSETIGVTKPRAKLHRKGSERERQLQKIEAQKRKIQEKLVKEEAKLKEKIAKRERKQSNQSATSKHVVEDPIPSAPMETVYLESASTSHPISAQNNQLQKDQLQNVYFDAARVNQVLETLARPIPVEAKTRPVSTSTSFSGAASTVDSFRKPAASQIHQLEVLHEADSQGRIQVSEATTVTSKTRGWKNMFSDWNMKKRRRPTSEVSDGETTIASRRSFDSHVSERPSITETMKSSTSSIYGSGSLQQQDDKTHKRRTTTPFHIFKSKPKEGSAQMLDPTAGYFEERLSPMRLSHQNDSKWKKWKRKEISAEEISRLERKWTEIESKLDHRPKHHKGTILACKSIMTPLYHYLVLDVSSANHIIDDSQDYIARTLAMQKLSENLMQKLSQYTSYTSLLQSLPKAAENPHLSPDPSSPRSGLTSPKVIALVEFHNDQRVVMIFPHFTDTTSLLELQRSVLEINQEQLSMNQIATDATSECDAWVEQVNGPYLRKLRLLEDQLQRLEPKQGSQIREIQFVLLAWALRIIASIYVVLFTVVKFCRDLVGAGNS